MTFLCDDEYLEAGERALKKKRIILESYIEKNPDFRTTHSPFKPDKAPELIRRMCIQSQKVGVGPMASVAGTLAFEALSAMLGAGVPEAIVDNGGDIALFIQNPVQVGIFAGVSSLNTIALEIEPRDHPFGICTSSGVVGHSFSYGKTNATIVFSSNVILADAAATALGNSVKCIEDLESCFDFFNSLPEIEGGLVILQDRMALWGRVPRLVRADVRSDLITMGRNPSYDRYIAE